MIRTVAMEFDLVCDRKGQVIFLSFIFQPLEIDSLYNETLELSGEWGRIPFSTFNFSFKKKRLKVGRGFFVWVNFSWEGGGALSQNSYEPSQDI